MGRLARVVLQVIFSTKQRKPWLKEPKLRAELYAYMATVLRENVDSPAILINGVEDHVHILCCLSRKFAIKNVVEKAKTETTKWIKRQSPTLRDFRRQNGYGVFSVSESKVTEVQRSGERGLCLGPSFSTPCARAAKRSWPKSFQFTLSPHGWATRPRLPCGIIC